MQHCKVARGGLKSAKREADSTRQPFKDHAMKSNLFICAVTALSLNSGIASAQRTLPPTSSQGSSGDAFSFQGDQIQPMPDQRRIVRTRCEQQEDTGPPKVLLYAGHGSLRHCDWQGAEQRPGQNPRPRPARRSSCPCSAQSCGRHGSLVPIAPPVGHSPSLRQLGVVDLGFAGDHGFNLNLK